MSIEIKTFKMRILDSDIRFNMKTVYKNNPITTKRHIVDWTNNDDLTVVLNNQVHNEYYDLQTFKLICDDPNGNSIFKITTDVNGIMNYNEISVVQEDMVPMRLKFLKNVRDYCEVYSRDDDAFEQKGMNVELYAIVLLVDNIYQGHIYAWLSPVNKNYCLVMGIRNRIDTIFVKNRPIMNVSHYLLEGVRRLTLSLNAKYTIVVYPKYIMKQILPKIGFIQDKLSSFIIGYSIGPYTFGSANCFTLADTSKSLINSDYKFTLILNH